MAIGDPRQDPRAVSVVLVTWDSAAFLERCLAALAAQVRPPHEVIVVDNGSRDESAAMARRHGAQVIETGRNLGFCRASNLGWAEASGGAALFLNPDVILDPGYLDAATAVFGEGGRIGMVAGKLLRFDGRTVDSAGQLLGRNRRAVERGYGRPDDGRYDDPGPIFSVCGAAALYRRSTLADVAPDGEVFDETFFAFHEDLDLGWRAQRRGWQGRYAPGATARHFRGATDAKVRLGGRRRARLRTLPDQLAVHAVKNRYLAMIKNDTWDGLLRDLPFVLGRELLLWGYLSLARPRVAWQVLRDGESRRSAWERRRRRSSPEAA